MIGLNQIFSLFELINSEKGTNFIAGGFALGMVFGFVPSNPVILTVLFFFFCLFRIHGGAMFLGWALFGILAYALDPLFEATVEATEEAILNALVVAETTTGRDGVTAHRLPHDRLIGAMARYGRLRWARAG